MDNLKYQHFHSDTLYSSLYNRDKMGGIVSLRLFETPNHQFTIFSQREKILASKIQIKNYVQPNTQK